MTSPTEVHRVGLDYLEAVTVLLNRIRTMHPTAGSYEAAELQWWWAQFPRASDDLEQLFWFDDTGRPMAAAIVTDWHGETRLDPLVLPGASSEWIAHVVRRGLDHANASGAETVELEVGTQDEELRALLEHRGFSVVENGLTESWLAADARPPVAPLHERYRLFDRGAVVARPHHMINEHRNHPDSEPRLRQTSLYRPDLDLVVYNDGEEVAAYGLFWYDPATAVGVVEPMRTEDDHQQLGLARHLLTSGLDRLADAGAKRLKVCFDPDNKAAEHLYLSAGFEPDAENELFAGPTAA